uniref:Uncharacterized protein n=1 Tax=Ascaris lumbricoides TaxID=6252 RepID=A0A9J2PED9_ASCLU
MWNNKFHCSPYCIDKYYKNAEHLLVKRCLPSHYSIVFQFFFFKFGIVCLFVLKEYANIILRICSVLNVCANIAITKLMCSMIFFLWSLVLSAVHYARKQRLTAILSQYFFSPYYHDTMLLCRRIPTVSSSARNILRVENALTNGGTGTSLWKMSSEPTLPFQSESSLLYRTEEVEIVAKPSWGEFHVKDWQIVARPLVTRTPRIAFIVSLGLASSKGGHSEQAGIELAGVLANENAFSSESHATYTQIQPVHVNRLCKKIASRRGRPWEIIYDCDLDEFYNITFAWSENALFDIDGKASVKSIQS